MSEIKRLAKTAHEAALNTPRHIREDTYVNIVRAILQAMREPGAGALLAGGRQIDFHDLIEEDEYASRFRCGLQAMIDHMLAEPS